MRRVSSPRLARRTKTEIEQALPSLPPHDEDDTRAWAIAQFTAERLTVIAEKLRAVSYYISITCRIDLRIDMNVELW